MRAALWKLLQNRHDAGDSKHRRRLRWLAAVLALVVVLLWLASPILLWAYDIERAGALMDRGLAWPEPRHFDSLPQMRDASALDEALLYLERAAARRPGHSQAYRLEGDVWAARGDWARAVAAYERAAELSPENPLPRWEASQAYAAMQRAVDKAPRISLMDALATGHLSAPGQLVKSLFCNDTGAASCYFGRTTFSLAYAQYPKSKPVTQPVLFLHPPASLSQRLAIPAAQSALTFMIGLDPVARDWKTDGATFRVFLETASQARRPIAELALDRAHAQSGWVLGWADLSPWAGQTVTLTLESDSGPAGDPSDDWFGWANVAFTTIDAARDATLFPQFRADALRQTVQ